MIGRLAELRGTLSSHWLASAFAGAYLVLSLVLGVALLSMPKESSSATAPAASIPTFAYEDGPTRPPAASPDSRDDSAGPRGTTTTTPSPTTTTTTSPPTTSAPVGFQPVAGPGGLRTVIPAGWRSAKTTGPGALQATDPADTVRYVKYGGSSAPDLDIESSHIQYENVFAVRAVDYRRITLTSARYGGHDAVEWEFEHREGATLLHVRSLYWRTGGTEYFVLAAAPAERWPAMRSVYDAMVSNATP
jgi:hypothetical protein